MDIHMFMPSSEPFFLQGSSTGCLLVHGFTRTPHEMLLLGEHVHKKGYAVLGVRLAGHSTDPHNMVHTRRPDWSSSVEDGWHLLSGCTKRLFLLGLSMGGVLSLLFAAY